MGIGLDPCHRAQAVPVGIDHAVGFLPCQPHPAEVSNPFEVFQATVPAIENHALRHETASVGRLQPCPEMIVLGQGFPSFVVESRSSTGMWRSPSVHNNVIQWMPSTTVWCLPDPCRRTHSIFRAYGLSSVESSTTRIPPQRVTCPAASRHSVAVSGSSRCNRRVIPFLYRLY